MKSQLLKKISFLFLLMSMSSLVLQAQTNKTVNVPGDATYTGTYNYMGDRNSHPYYKHATQNCYLYVDNYCGSYGNIWLLASALVVNPNDAVVKYYQWPDTYPTIGDPGDLQWWDVTTNCDHGNCQQSITITDAAAGVAPTVSTDAASLVTTTSGTMNGNIVADGGAATDRGFVYSSSDATPTIGEGGVIQVTKGTGTGTFSELVGSLTAGATYYYQAYGHNSYGNTYGGVKSFTTPTTGQPNKYLSGVTNPSAANGVYIWIGNYYGKPAWKHQTSNYWIYYSITGWDSNYFWYIDDELKNTHGTYDYLFNHADAASCPGSGWVTEDGTGTLSIIDYPNITFTNGTAYSPGNPTGGTTNNPIGRFTLSGELAGASLTGATITVTGTRTNVSNLKIWSSTDATFNSGSDTQLNSQLDGSTVTFSGFSSSISTSGSNYFITADLASNSSGTIALTIGSQDNLTISGGAIASGFSNASLSSGTLTIISAPEIDIKGNNTSIADGDAVPSSADYTDFGSTDVSAGTVARTFAIENTGSADLTISSVNISGSHAADFSVTTSPAATVTPSNTTTFEVTFNPSASGTRSATLSIANNDANENPYDFAIQGTGTNTTPVATAPSAPTVVEDDVNVALADDIQVADAGGDNQTVTFTITGGTLTIGVTGITFGGGGNGSASFTASGTLADINAALDAATFTPTANLSGTNAATISFKSNDEIEDSNTASVTFSITAVNDEPGLTATGNNPTFTEDGAASDLYSSITITTPESGQIILQLVLTVANVSDGANEILTVDGSDIALTNGNSGTTSTNGMSFSVSVSGGTATVTISKAAGISVAAMQTLVDGITYRNTSNSPNTSNRVVTLTSVQDNGGTANGGDDTATLSVVSTVTVAASNDAPTLTSFAGVVETTTQNTEVEITLAELKVQGNEADVDGTVDAFIVKVLSSGALKIGASPGSAAAFNATTNKTIDASNNAYWTPASDVYGTINVFTTTVVDNNGLESTGAVQATVKVNDVTNPQANSITISGSPAATATSVTFVVVFSEPVVNVSTDDFSLTLTGTASGTIASVSSSSGTSINVTVNSIAGTGTLRLDLNASTNIADASTNTPPAAFTSGSVHTVDRDNPTLSSSTPADGATGFSPSGNIILTFSENIVFGTGNIQIIDTNDGSGTITIDVAAPGAQASISDDILTLNPTSILEENTNYAVQIAATAIDDSYGNSYTGISDNTTLNFTSGIYVPRFIGPGTDFLNNAYWESGHVPAQNLDIIIGENQNLVISQNYTCKSLKFESGSSFQCTGGFALTITGNILDANDRVAIYITSALVVRSSIIIPNGSQPSPE